VSELQLWDPDAHKVVLTIKDNSAPEHWFRQSIHVDTGWPSFSHDGQRILVINGLHASVYDATGGERAVLRGHEGLIRMARFSPDGKRVVTASEDRTVRVWDSGRGTPVACFRGHTRTARFAAFRLDGESVVSLAEDDTFRFWRVQPVRPHVQPMVPPPEPVSFVAYSPDGSCLLTGGPDATVRVREVKTGKLVATLRDPADRDGIDNPAGRFLASARGQFSGDGRRVLVVADQCLVKVVDQPLSLFRAYTESEVKTRTLPFTPVRLFDARGAAGRSLAGITSSPSVATFSPDGKRVLVAEVGQVMTLTVWPRGQVVHNVDTRLPGVARLYDSRTGKLLWTTPEHPTAVATAAFSPDGRRVLTCCARAPTDNQRGQARLWDTATGKELGRFDLESIPWQAVYSPDGGRLVTHQSDALWTAAYSHGGNSLKARAFQVLQASDATHDAELRDGATGRLLTRLKGGLASGFSPDGKLLLTIAPRTAEPGGALVAGRYVVNVIAAKDGRVVCSLAGHERDIAHALFSPDARRVGTASFDGTVRLWDTASGRELLRLPCARSHSAGQGFRGDPLILQLAFTPDGGRLITVGTDGRALVWELDLAAVARRSRPRDFTAEERSRYEIEETGPGPSTPAVVATPASN
jgi:WD40 repeat protein